MAYDTYIRLRQGSLRPVYADINAGAGNTATIQSGGTFTLYNSDGVVASGFNAVAVSGFNGSSVQEPNIWYVLNTASLAPGMYAGIISFTAVGSDDITRNFDIDVQIEVLAPVEVEASYDDADLLTTPLYEARLHASDADTANAIFTDNEWIYFLNKAGSVPTLAAAFALDVMASDRAKLANAVQIGSFGNGEKEAYKAILERAAHLRAISIVPASVEEAHNPFDDYERRRHDIYGGTGNW